MMNAVNLLYPYVVPTSWVEFASPDAVLSWQLAEDVHIVLVFDGQGVIRTASPRVLTNLGLDADDAFDTAAFNLGRAWQRLAFEVGLATLSDGTRIGCARGNWMAPAAGLLFGNFHAELAEEFGCDELAAVAVNQSCLFAFPTDPVTLSSQALRTAIDDEFLGHPKPISRQWLLLDGRWPRQFPGRQPF